MRIVVDIGHPAHVHYFKHLIHEMERRGHEFLIFARDRTHVFELLRAYQISALNRGKGGSSLAGKLAYIFKGDLFIYRHARRFKPDLFLSFGSMYAAHAATLLRKPCIILDDTEHSTKEHAFYVPFADCIVTPYSFQKEFGEKQLRFKGFIELCYLHSKYFKPDPAILDILGVAVSENYAILRFVSWDAVHDRGHGGLDLASKIALVKALSKQLKVFISVEGFLPPELEPYRIGIAPEHMHDALAFATLFVGEGATMASECAMIGTPAIYVNSLDAGTLQQQEAYGLIHSFRDGQGVIPKALALVKRVGVKEEYRNRSRKMRSQQIDVTAFLIWLVEGYPESYKALSNDPSVQNRFRG